jgi:FixJ family two-component response regulator
MKGSVATVHVIDPDPHVRTAVRDVVGSMNVQCSSHGTGREFFAAYAESQPGCVVLEVKIPDMGGYQIQRRLASNGCPVPLIFLSSTNDVSLAVELLRGGAVHYLQKPMRPVELIKAIHEALAIDAARREASRQRQAILESIAVLTAKERDVLRLIADGKSNQQIAAELHLGLRTVELRRANLIKKLSLKSPLELLHFALLAQRDGRDYLEDYRQDLWTRYSMTLVPSADGQPPISVFPVPPGRVTADAGH